MFRNTGTIIQWLILGVLLVTGLGAEAPLGSAAEETGRLAFTPPASGQKLFSLFEPSKFSLAHSYTFSFSTDGTQTFYNSLYLNTINYRISPPLLLKLKWGLVHFPPTNGSGSYLSRSNLVMPGVELLYRPSSNFMVKLQYSNFPLSSDPAAVFRRSIE